LMTTRTLLLMKKKMMMMMMMMMEAEVEHNYQEGCCQRQCFFFGLLFATEFGQMHEEASLPT
jgi:hypothetical protein